MKILLIGNYINDKQESMQRFANTLKNNLIGKGHTIKLIRPEPFFGKLAHSNEGLGKWLGYLDKFIMFPKKIKKAKKWADIVHICDHSNAVYIKYLQYVPHLVTCNDMLAIRSAMGQFKGNRVKWTGKILQSMILKGLNETKRLACISKKTMQDLMRLSTLSSDKCCVVYMGLNYSYRPLKKKEAKKPLEILGVPIGTKFILHVGNNSWYKNRLGVLKIFTNLMKNPKFRKIKMVMVGKPFTKKMKEYIIKNDLETKVIELIALENELLRVLYSNATALIFPSLQEGFGWPIAEAQACGCPVFTSNRPPMTEVGGEAAVYFDPEKPKEAAGVIAKNLRNAKQMRKMGFENAKKFSTKKMIESYIKLYKEILKK